MTTLAPFWLVVYFFSLFNTECGLSLTESSQEVDSPLKGRVKWRGRMELIGKESELANGSCECVCVGGWEGQGAYDTGST